MIEKATIKQTGGGEKEMRGYVLIQTYPGKAAEVCRKASNLTGVKMADLITGPFDVIVHVDTTDFSACGHLVMDQIQKIDGVWRTLTCLTVEL
ncbi:MAG: Lrp/AsnC ligand binding domain-containing protein [Actinomycetota bacterium]|nr:Lrp/AsnC ligand binding domain-containing protein [Actinomycetota bacterium]